MKEPTLRDATTWSALVEQIDPQMVSEWDYWDQDRQWDFMVAGLTCLHEFDRNDLMHGDQVLRTVDACFKCGYEREVK